MFCCSNFELLSINKERNARKIDVLVLCHGAVRGCIKEDFVFAPHHLSAALYYLNAWNRLCSVIKSMSELTELVALKN